MHTEEVLSFTRTGMNTDAWLLHHRLKISIKNWKNSLSQTGQCLCLKTVLWMKPQLSGLCWGWRGEESVTDFLSHGVINILSKQNPPGIEMWVPAALPWCLSHSSPHTYKHSMRQQKELKPATLSGRKFPNALWYAFSFSVVWSGWMLLVRS